MATEFIEQVARAMCLDRDADNTAGGPHPSGTWLDKGEPWWTGYVEQVHAVLTVMRDPSTAMLSAGANTPPFKGYYGDEAAAHAAVDETWTVMIDAALQEKE